MILNRIDDIISLNKLWNKIFPYLAVYLKDIYGREEGEILEFGVFSGGVSIELLKLSVGYRAFISGLESKELMEYVKGWAEKEGVGERIEIMNGFGKLGEKRFDLVICRGFFFYLEDEGVLKKISEILKPEGMAILGGGYGARTPDNLIKEISRESKVLNERLGRRRFGKEEIEEILRRHGLIERSSIIEEGGLWIKMSKDV